jgi:hypothetical protein
MDSLMQLLSYVLRPLSTLAKSDSSTVEKLDENVNSEQSSGNAGTGTSANLSEDSATVIIGGEVQILSDNNCQFSPLGNRF